MSVQLRPWEEGDDLKLLEIFGDAENPQQHQDRAMLRVSTNTPFTRCLVAEENDVTVAAAVVYSSSTHPQRLWFYAETAPGERLRGIATTLLTTLRQEIAEARESHAELAAELKARYAEPNEHTDAFLTAQGFRPIQRSRRVVIGPGSLAVPELSEDALQLEELATGSVELTRLVQSFYELTHQWDPADITIGRIQQLLLAPETGAAGAVVLRDQPKSAGGRILAFAISYTAMRDDEHITEVLIGWNPDLEPADAQFALAGLLGMLTAQYPVELEVDDSMGPLLPIIDGLVNTGHAQVEMTTRILATDG